MTVYKYVLDTVDIQELEMPQGTGHPDVRGRYLGTILG